MEPPAHVETTSGIDNDEFPDSKLIDSKVWEDVNGELEMRLSGTEGRSIAPNLWSAS